MYNRYTRNDTGVYTRMPQSEPSSDPPKKHTGFGQNAPGNTPQNAPGNTLQNAPGKNVFASPNALHSTPFPQRPERDVLNRVLEKLHLGDLDAGDLLVLLLLFMLFREKADEELLIALGLLLIL
ncbi:MAG: hypothetical protein MR888_05795 [Clostridiales bacterium]|nr:hypothetical protein [Clostridiales bacterium]